MICILSDFYTRVIRTDFHRLLFIYYNSITETVRERSFELIGRAYTSISVSEFSKYIGMTEENAISIALKEPGWTVNHQEKLICPVRRQQTELTTVQAEQQLTTLTNFVSFLEK